MAKLVVDILEKEITGDLPHWLHPIEKQDKQSPSKQAIRDKHRAKYVAEQQAKLAAAKRDKDRDNME